MHDYSDADTPRGGGRVVWWCGVMVWHYRNNLLWASKMHSVKLAKI